MRQSQPNASAIGAEAAVRLGTGKVVETQCHQSQILRADSLLFEMIQRESHRQATRGYYSIFPAPAELLL